MLLKLLADLIDLLLPAQTLLVLHLLQPALLVSVIGGLETALGVPVDLLGIWVAACEVEGVESVVDTRGGEAGLLFVAVGFAEEGGVVESGEVEAFALLRGSLFAAFCG